MKAKGLNIWLLILITCCLDLPLSLLATPQSGVTPTDTSQLNTYFDKAYNLEETNPDSAFFFYEQALKVATASGDRLSVGDSYVGFGYCFEKQNLHRQSLEMYLEALNIFEELNDNQRLAECFNYIGDIYVLLNSHGKALENYHNAMLLYQDLKDDEGISTIQINRGNIYYDRKEYKKAESNYLKALTICKELNDDIGISTCLINLGNIYADQHNFDKGIFYYKRALKIEEKLKSKEGISSIYNNLGDTYLAKGDLNLSLEYLTKALKLAEDINNVDLLAITNLNISTVKLKQKKYSDAIKISQTSLDYAQKIGALSYQAENYQNLATVHDSLKNYELAYRNHVRFKQINDSIYNVDKQKRFEQLDALYQLEKNQQKVENLTRESDHQESMLKYQRAIIWILLLGAIPFIVVSVLLYWQFRAKSKAFKELIVQKKEIEKMHKKIEVQRDHLDELNVTKDKFFSIIAHDLKNPFNSIIGFTDLIIENLQENSPEDNQNYLKIIKTSSIQALNLLQNLLLWARSQTGSIVFNPVTTNLEERLAETISFLEVQAAKKNIQIIPTIKRECVVEADVNMLDTILRNLLSNAIKYTNQNGKIEVNCAMDNGFCKITVKDNGIGISEDEINKLFRLETKFSNLGTENEHGSGLGLLLCHDFVQRHGGKIEVKSEPGKGSEFIFTLPCANKKD